MLGNPGSNPLELFWDVVDGLDQKLDAKIAVVEDGIRKIRLEPKDGDGEDDSMTTDEKKPIVGPDTSWDNFVDLVKETQDPAVKKLSDESLMEIFDTVRMIGDRGARNQTHVMFYSCMSRHGRSRLTRGDAQNGSKGIYRMTYGMPLKSSQNHWTSR
jgi:hypothetical protein